MTGTCVGCHALYLGTWPRYCLLGYITSSATRLVGVPVPEDPDEPVFIPGSRIDYLETKPGEECPGPVTEEQFASTRRAWETHSEEEREA